MEESPEHRYVLYINKSYTIPSKYDDGSEQCIELTRDRTDVMLQDVDAIIEKGIELPSWLDGTPVLVDTSSSTALKGSAAIDRLSKLRRQATLARPVAPPRGAEPRPAARAPPAAEEEEDSDPFRSDKSNSPEISERANQKVDDTALQRFLEERAALDKRVTTQRPNAGALPPPLPANS